MNTQNNINHINLVLDASSSMDHLAKTLIRVVDEQIEYLAKRSDELGQETRVSIYTFSYARDIKCLVYDMDVLRLPSIESLYKVGGMTALVDATLKSIEDLEQTATLYGNHAFLTYVLTDGMENNSLSRPSTLARRLNSLPGNWTVAALVPDQSGVSYCVQSGFQNDNIAIWDATSAAGVMKVGETIRQATDNFMVARSKGNFVGTRSLFSTGADAVNATTVRSALTPLAQNQYHLIPVHADSPIREYIYSRGLDYVLGNAFYQLTKREKIQAQKKIAIREKATGKVYSGQAARDVLGLPNMETTVKPDFNPDYDVFVQSTSVNRKLIANTDVLVLR